MTDLLDSEPLADDEVKFFCRDLDGPEECPFSTVSMSGLRRHQTRSHGFEPAGHSRREDRDEEGGADTEESSGTVRPPRAAPTRSPAPETPPRASKPGLLDRWRRRRRARKSGGGPARVPKPSKQSGGKRMPIASDITSLWFFAGRQLESTSQFPAGRMMAYEALAAGPIVDEAIAGTALDRWVVQPIWHQKDRYEKVFYLVGPVVLVGMMQSMNIRMQAAFAAGDLETAKKIQVTLNGWSQVAGTMMRSAMVQMAPSIAQAKERMAAEDEAIREAFPDLPPGADPIQALFSDLFAPPGVPPDAGPATEEASDVGYSSAYANGDGPSA